MLLRYTKSSVTIKLPYKSSSVTVSVPPLLWCSTNYAKRKIDEKKTKTKKVV